MPPNLDIYVFSPNRDRESIDRFLRDCVDRPACEDRAGEEMMLVPINSAGKTETGDEWDWEPSVSLTHMVDRGLDFPRRAFSIYLRPRDVSLSGATLGFDTNNQVIFGLSLDDEGGQPENLEKAKVLLHELVNSFAGTRGFVLVEDPPPLKGAFHFGIPPLCTWCLEGHPK
jgi:hypothetical protein